jgi:hypothetical protein
MNVFSKIVRRIRKRYRIIYKRSPSNVALFFAGIAVMGWLSFLLLSGFPLVQYIYYTVRPATSARLAKVLSEVSVRAEGDPIPNSAPQVPTETVLPPLDTSLPDGHYLSIPLVGVDSVIWEAPRSEYEDALEKGVWRHPETGIPGGSSPVILAAHRFGYLEWDNAYRRKNSFFNLPKLKAGDTFVYRIEKVAEGTEFDSYNYDAILYTCKFLVSPVRYFVYANLVK